MISKHNRFTNFTLFSLFVLIACSFTVRLSGQSIIPWGDYVYYIYTTDGSFTAPAGVTAIDVLVAGGGGGGGGSITDYGGGGGGAGGACWGECETFTRYPTENFQITIGKGGAGGGPGGFGSNGGDSTFMTPEGGYQADGGNGGNPGSGSMGGRGGNSGSSFKGSSKYAGETTIACGGGGAGSDANGGKAENNTGGTGGDGIDISDFYSFYTNIAAGGGGGRGNDSQFAGAGGHIGGGAGVGADATTFGSGGGGAAGVTGGSSGGRGADGVVIIRFASGASYEIEVDEEESQLMFGSSFASADGGAWQNTVDDGSNRTTLSWNVYNPYATRFQIIVKLDDEVTIPAGTKLTVQAEGGSEIELSTSAQVLLGNLPLHQNLWVNFGSGNSASW